jgi:hypothetical protein
MAAVALGMSVAIAAIALGSEPAVRWETVSESELNILVDDVRVATFSIGDARIRRPFFANVIAPCGIPMTRRFPPMAGEDLVDHDTMHPGIWLAFSDINRQDFWRNRATVKTELLSKRADSGIATIVFRNRYCTLEKKDPICDEHCTVRWIIRPDHYLVLWDSTLSSNFPFTLGDQEEMGLGVRLATPLRSSSSREDILTAGNGNIFDAAGRRGEKEVWGKSSRWCNYSGVIDGRQVGAVLMPHPDNFRPSSFHVRGTGFVAANPFGSKVFGRSDDGSIRVEPGEMMRLRFGLLFYCSDVERADFHSEFEGYVAAAKD